MGRICFWLAPAVIGVVDHHEDTNVFSTAPLRIVDPAVRESLGHVFGANVPER